MMSKVLNFLLNVVSGAAFVMASFFFGIFFIYATDIIYSIGVAPTLFIYAFMVGLIFALIRRL